MFDASWLNVGSLVFGLAAWTLPITGSFMKDGKRSAYAISSLVACTIALCMQMVYSYHLVKIEDWSALMDTSGAVVFASAALVAVTILLNVYAWFFRNGRTESV